MGEVPEVINEDLIPDVESWAYRWVRDGGENTWSVREVYFDSGGNVVGWSGEPISLGGLTSFEDLASVLGMILKDCSDTERYEEVGRGDGSVWLEVIQHAVAFEPSGGRPDAN